MRLHLAVLDDRQQAFAGAPARARLGGHQVEVFDDHLEGAALGARLSPFDAVLLIQQRTPLTREVLSFATRLKLVSQTGRGTSHLDLAACRERGITVCAGGQNPPHAPAELTWALILAARRRLPEEVAALRAGRWGLHVGAGLHGKTLGVWAYGRVGAAVAQVGRAFGMRVVCFGREASTARARADGFEVVAREALFAESDVLTLHLPLNAQTRGAVTPADLARMQPSSLLVNTSRAALVGDAALAAALAQGRPGSAAVDVFEVEPAPPTHPLLALPNLLATPHLGYVERETLDGAFAVAVDQVLAFAAGAPINVVG